MIALLLCLAIQSYPIASNHLEASAAACVDKNAAGCRGYLRTRNARACEIPDFKRDCPQTCDACAPPPSCVAKGSVGQCQNCRVSSQCAGGRYCCPYMKVGVPTHRRIAPLPLLFRIWSHAHAHGIFPRRKSTDSSPFD